MTSRSRLAAMLFATMTAEFFGAQSAHAEPLTPLTPGETQYLQAAHHVLTVSHDPMTFHSDGELLVYGRYACDKRPQGIVGYGGTQVSPALIQLAFIYLCPG